MFALPLVAQIVVAQTTQPAGGSETILDKILDRSGDAFNLNFIEGDSFKKFLLFLLSALILYSIGGFLPFLGKNVWINGVVAGVLSFLIIFYLTTEEINSILLSYGALGIVLTGVIPFFAIAAISKRAYDGGYEFAAKFLWLAFIIVLGIRWLSATPEEIGSFGTLIYPILGIAALAMFLWEKRFYAKWFKEKTKALIEKSKQMSAAARASKKEYAKDVYDTSDMD